MNHQPGPEVGVLRREPYRLLFPIGILLTWCGVLPWLTNAVWGVPAWPAIFHSIAQVEGFLASFVVGFLFTMIPRRTGTAPPSAWELALGASMPVAITVAVWWHAVALSQLAWLVLLGTLLQFLVRRARRRDAARRPPDAFVWIPMGLGMALFGTLLLGLYGPLHLDGAWHVLGQGLLVEGLMLSLVVGVGSMLIPLLTRQGSSTDGDPERPGPRRLHLVAGALLAVSFAIQAFVDSAFGHGMRAVVVALVLTTSAGILRTPTAPGLHRRLVWLAAWAIPTGYALAALLPATPQIGRHVVFLGGFAWMTLAVGLHVTLAHGGRQDLVHRSPWPVRIMVALLALALVARGLVHADPLRMRWWIGIAAGCYLAATLAWVVMAAAGYRRPERPAAGTRGPGLLRVAGP